MRLAVVGVFLCTGMILVQGATTDWGYRAVCGKLILLHQKQRENKNTNGNTKVKRWSRIVLLFVSLPNNFTAVQSGSCWTSLLAVLSLFFPKIIFFLMDNQCPSKTAVNVFLIHCTLYLPINLLRSVFFDVILILAIFSSSDSMFPKSPSCLSWAPRSPCVLFSGL